MPNFLKIFIFLSFIVSIVVSSSHNVQAASFTELRKSADIQTGFVDVIYNSDDGKTYLKIHNIGDEFIYQTSLPSGLGSNDIGLDRGQLGNTSLTTFERAGNKLLLKQKPSNFRAVSDNLREAQAIDEAFASSVLWGFLIIDSGVEQALSLIHI